MKIIIYNLMLFVCFVCGASATDQSESGDLSQRAVRYAVFEGRSDWRECYKMLSKALTNRIAFETFNSRMNSFPFEKTLKKPIPVHQSTVRSGGIEIGRVILRDEEAPIGDQTQVSALTLIKEDGQWHVFSVSGLKSVSVIDETFFCGMVDRELKSK